MAKKKKELIVVEPVVEKKAKKKPEDEVNLSSRTQQLGERASVSEALSDIYTSIEQGFDDKQEQNTIIDRCWDVYNCVLNDQQFYYGNSQIYVPIVKDAIEARVTRYCNQLFPKDGRYVDAVSTDGSIPYEIISLLDHYVEKSDLRSSVGPALIRMGDVTGQYSLMVDWNEIKRYTTKRKIRSDLLMEDENGEDIELELDDEDSTYEDVEDVTIEEGMPAVTVLDPRDLLVLPATVDRIEDASIVAVAIRMSEKMVRSYVKRGIFDEDKADILLGQFSSRQESSRQPDAQKKAAHEAGVHTDSQGNKAALVYMAWSTLDLGNDEERLCVTYYGGPSLILGCTRNPFWNDKINIISTPALKVAGSFWGKSRVEGGVEKMQYAANDAVNMGFDSAQFALLPIVMTDPAANPRSGSMVLATAAIWEVDPKSTVFASMPPVWKDAFQLVSACKDQIQQSMSTNPAMMPNGAAAKKPTQAQIAQEQQVALESTADVVNILEDGVFTKLVEWMADLDYQYRKRSTLIRQFGPLGYYATMEEIPPFQTGKHYKFSWYGSEGFKAAQEVQQMIAATNVLRGIPPQQLGGRILDLGPVVDHLAKTAFGPRLAPNILKDQRHQMSIQPEEENEMLTQDFLLPVSPFDNDVEHLKVHQQALKAFGDPNGYIRAHMQQHIHQMQAKQQAQMGPPPGMPGTPGSPPAGPAPGIPGQAGPMPQAPMLPRPGAQPGQMRGVQNPPGAIHPDNMVDPGRMPN